MGCPADHVLLKTKHVSLPTGEEIFPCQKAGSLALWET